MSAHHSSSIALATCTLAAEAWLQVVPGLTVAALTVAEVCTLKANWRSAAVAGACLDLMLMQCQKMAQGDAPWHRVPSGVQQLVHLCHVPGCGAAESCTCTVALNRGACCPEATA